jgi:O-antigen ligase
VCALVAPSHRGPASKFALRAVGGGLLFFAARDLLRERATAAHRLGLGILVGAGISAAGAVVETVLPDTGGLWHSFRTTTFTVTGLPRPSGPFEYPTIAAMYWEAALALAVALPAWPGLGLRPSQAPASPSASPSARARGAALDGVAIAVAAVLVLAILFSATRTALVVAALASGAMAALAFAWGGARRLRVAAGSTLALVAVLAGVTLASPAGASPLALRLRWWQDGSWYLARYGLLEPHLTMDAGAVTEVPVTVENAGGLVWPHAGEDAVRLSYHWEKDDALGAHLDFEGRRSALPSDLPPGASVRVLGTVQAPDEPGRYRLRWDLVREHVTWFSERGNGTADQTVDVVKVTAGAPPRRRPTIMVESTLEDWVASYTPTRPDLWRAALHLWRAHPLSGVGPDNFRRVYGDALPAGAQAAASAAAGGAAAQTDARIHANSLYLETLADLGAAGAMALGWLMVAIVRTAWRCRSAGPGAPLAAAYAIGVATFFVHGLLDWFFEFTPTYGLFWLLLALLANAATAPEGARTPLGNARPGSRRSSR